jgi:hypothetical protein
MDKQDTLCGEQSSRATESCCNLCGLSCNLKNWGPEGLIDAVVIGGYESTPGNGSGALDDMTRYRFSICEFCLDWLFTKFRIPVVVDDPMNDYLLDDGETIEEGLERMGVVQILERPQPNPWRPAAQRVAEDDWRKMKDEFYAEAARRSAARERREG